MVDYADGATQERRPSQAELQVALNLIPTHTWYANPSGAVTFVNERASDYLGLPKVHPLRSGIKLAPRGIPISPFFTPMTMKKLLEFGPHVYVQAALAR